MVLRDESEVYLWKRREGWRAGSLEAVGEVDLKIITV
jgi:hypothetical protein